MRGDGLIRSRGARRLVTYVAWYEETGNLGRVVRGDW